MIFVEKDITKRIFVHYRRLNQDVNIINPRNVASEVEWERPTTIVDV